MDVRLSLRPFFLPFSAMQSPDYKSGGGVAEWSIAAVSKTAAGENPPAVGSNPASAASPLYDGL